MRIHQVRLTNYRGVAEAEIQFPAEGVTIVEGDNEVGKTSIAEAIDLVLNERDDSTKKAVKAVKPVDKDVGAEVEIEFSTGPYRLRYRKRWHRQKETVLELLEPERAQLTGREAHDRVRVILEETMDGSLWDALRMHQGRKLEQAAFAGGSLGRALDLASGGESAGDREDDLWARVTAERDRYWTPSGQVKVERANAGSRVEECRTTVAELEADLVALENDAQQVERLVAEGEQLLAKQDHQSTVLEELTSRVEDIKALRNEVDRLTGLAEKAELVHERSLERNRARVTLVEVAATTTDAVAALEAELSRALPARNELDSRLRAAKAEVERAKAEVRKADDSHRQAVDDQDYRRQQIELAQLSERHGRVVEAIQRRTAAEAVLAGNNMDATLASRIDTAHLELVKAREAAEAGATLVHATAERDLSLRVNDTVVELGSGDSHEIVVTESARVEVPGTMGLVIRSGSEAHAVAERLDGAQVAFDSACAEGHVADLAEARRAAEDRADAERDLAEAARSIEQDLRDLTQQALAEKVQHLGERIVAFEAERQVEPPLPTDLDAAQAAVAELDTALRDRRDELDRLERDLEAANAAIQEAEVGGAESRARLEQAEVARAQAETSLAAARENFSDEALAAEVVETRTVLEEATEKLSTANGQLAAEDPASAEELLDNARAVKKRLADDLHSNDNRIRELRTKLSVRGDEGLANQLDVAKTELVQLSRQYEGLEARAHAAKRLHDTFAARRAEAHHRYVAPFRERIEQLGRLVFDGDLEIEVGDDLCIESRTLEGVTIDFDDLSTGAQEQLGMISRLACASIVSAEGGAPVIFDDALGWSDPLKLERMGAAISKAGRSCQIIVLTCTPGRYESVGNATVVRLPCFG